MAFSKMRIEVFCVSRMVAMFSKCIEPFCAAPSTSPVAVLVLVEIDFPGSLGGKPKLNFRLVSEGMYTKCGSYAHTQLHLVESKQDRNNNLEISYVDVLYVHYTCTRECHLNQSVHTNIACSLLLASLPI